MDYRSIIAALAAGVMLVGCSTQGASPGRSTLDPQTNVGPSSHTDRHQKQYYYFVLYPTGVDLYTGEPRLVRVVGNTDTPAAIAVDGKGRLFVANDKANNVTVYAYKGKTLLQTVSDGVAQPRAVAVDSSGTLYVANKSDVTVYKGARLKNAYKLHVKTVNTVTVDQNNNVYFRTVANNQPELLVYAPNAKSPKVVITEGVASDGPVTVGSDGTVFVGNRSKNASCGKSSVTEYRVGATSPSLTVTDGICDPSAITLDQANDMLIANYYGNNVDFYAAGSDHPSGPIFTKNVVKPVGVFNNEDNYYILSYAGLGVYVGSSYRRVATPAHSSVLLPALEAN